MALYPVHVEGWLAFNQNGTARWTRKEPNLDRSERAIKIKLSVPASLFQTPTLKANITIPADSMPAAFEINAETAADALKSALGVDIDLQVIPHDKVDR